MFYFQLAKPGEWSMLPSSHRLCRTGRFSSFAGLKLLITQSMTGKISRTLVKDIVAKRSSKNEAWSGWEDMEPVGVRATSLLLGPLRFRHPSTIARGCLHYGETPSASWRIPDPFPKVRITQNTQPQNSHPSLMNKSFVVGVRGFEPPASSTRTMRATTALHPDLKALNDLM